MRQSLSVQYNKEMKCQTYYEKKSISADGSNKICLEMKFYSMIDF